MNRAFSTTLAILAVATMWCAPSRAQSDAPLPDGVRAVWDFGKAYRETTPTRERICINGLWRWQPAKNNADQVPAANWGYFKVPACWPGITDYMQKDCQTVHAHPSWKDEKRSGVSAAWYQREVSVPNEWAGRRIVAQAGCLNSFATVFVDAKNVGEMRFPSGELDITSACPPGSKHGLSMHVLAMPLDAVMLSYNDSNAAKEMKGTVRRRGLCGDVFLASMPRGTRITDARVDTSTRKWEISFNAALEALKTGESYSLNARLTEGGRRVVEFKSKPFRVDDLKDGRIAFSEKWKPEKLWDTHTPKNQYELQLSLLDAGGKVLDAWHTIRFGFREFWIDGRDFYLNGSRIYLSAVPLDNAQVGAAWATYEGAKESMLRLRTFGINFVYTHNYDCQPGSHLGFVEVLRAADDVGMLVSFSQPHFGQYKWEAADADENNGYARHAEFYVRTAQNHPSVIFYSMSHNATGYGQDMNPDLIDGIYEPTNQWSVNNRKKATRAEAIVKRLDPSRVVYHHSSGNLGSMHTSNFYPNWAPIQELSDWFEHWATKGVKPLFTCEFGAPFSWDWAMYRGWYKKQRTFGSAVVPWEFCLAEWNSQFFGDRAFQISQMEKQNLRWEARKFQAGQLWYRWDYPHQLGSGDFPEREPVFAMYLADNWRAFRTWGVSANSPWEHGLLYKLRDGMNRNVRKDLATDWENLQRPGFSPDYIQEVYERMDLAYERTDWVATEAAKTLMRNNMPLLAYIGGKPARFTSKDHIFRPGETVEKQLIAINNSRQTVTCDCSWSLALPQPAGGNRKLDVDTGQQERVPLSFPLSATLKPGQYKLAAKIKFGTGETQEDEFLVHVIARRPAPKTTGKLALFDPKGETAALLKAMGVRFETVDAGADLSKCDVFIVGKAALTLDGPAPDISRVREGLKVLMFEQTPEVLEKRFGFRIAEYGLRQVFKRVPEHPALAGLQTEHLRDWRGEATVIPSRLQFAKSPEDDYGFVFTWCGIPVTRVYRCGNRGNVAGVLIEKPARGDFLPIVDGGFSLQYSPLMEYREGKGLVLFCQMDVTGRTESDPAAETLTANIIEYVSGWKPSPRREAVYAGEPAGKKHFESAGLTVGSYSGGELKADQVLVVGPGGGKALAANKEAVAAFLRAGGHLLAVGLNEAEAGALLPFRVTMKESEHINAYFEPQGFRTPLAGVGPADAHNRAPRNLPLVTGGTEAVGDGVLAATKDAAVVFCQMVPWQFDYQKNYGLKRTFRRSAFLVSRLLANMGAAGSTPVLARFHSQVTPAEGEKRWLEGLYLDTPEEWDDPYRFFRW